MIFRRFGIGIALALVLCAAASAAEPVDISLNRSTAEMMDPVCGIWQMAPGGGIFAIEAYNSPGTYKLTLLDSPDYTIAPGTAMGTMRATATPLVFDAEVFSRPGDPLSRRRTMFIEIDSTTGRLTMKPYTNRVRVSLRRWLPYLFRISIERESNRPQGHDGAVRLGISSLTPVAL